MRLEPPGRAGLGVEFEIDEDGVTWVEQVKGSAGGTWTIVRLEREGVLDSVKAHVAAGSKFRLVASTAAPQLEDLSARARATQSLAEFSESLTIALKSDLEKLTRNWKVTTAEAWALLKRVHVEHHPAELLRLLTTAEFKVLFVDDAEVVIAELRRFYEDHLHENLTGPQIWAHLGSKGFHRRLLVGDQGVLDSLQRTVERHHRRLERSMPTVGLVPRADTESVLDRLRAADSAQITVLDGPAGFGKSTIVDSICGALGAEGWFVAVARMDGVGTSVNTSDKLGAGLGLCDSPAVLLANVADGLPALLVVEQLDAVSTSSGRMGDNFEAVDEVLHELARVPNVRILLVVRTVDLEGDPRLRRLVAGPGRVERHYYEAARRWRIDVVPHRSRNVGARPRAGPRTVAYSATSVGVQLPPTSRSESTVPDVAGSL